MNAFGFARTWKQKNLLQYSRWPWHLAFWTGYALFRFWHYYITVKFYPPVFLEYMLISEAMFVCITYFTVWLYKRLFEKRKFLVYFLAGVSCWLLYLYGRTVFQFYYLQDEPRFKGNSFPDIFINNIAVVVAYFLFITSCKFFKDGYIRQQFDAERKQEQLLAEVNHLKSQIAPHFLFNTLNNLYGLSVEKSDKLPDLMLRLSDLLRHSLYETQKPLVSLAEEINILKSYIKLESIRLEDYLELEFDNQVPEKTPYLIAPLILIVFMENAFKHSKLVQSAAVNIHIRTTLENNCFGMTIRNNYNRTTADSGNGIGLINVRRRLDLLYPEPKHQLFISRDDRFYTVSLQMQLVKTD